MGQFEVLRWLIARRESGDHAYRTYAQIHEAMRREGFTESYVSMWRSINRLHSSELIEAVAEGGILQRKVLFRARMISNVRGSDMKRVHNTYRGLDETSRSCSAEATRGLAARSAGGRRPVLAGRGGRRRRLLW